MQLIPSLVLQHLSNPANIEELFIKYIEKAGLRIDASKTIAGVAYFHKLNFGTDTSRTFFKGAYDPTLTNMPGNSFIRPQSEHILIWAMRMESGIGLTPTGLVFTPGVGLSPFLNALEMTVTTNSEVKIKDYPLSEGLSNLTTRDDGVIPLAEPIFWGGQQDFIIDVVNGDGIVGDGQQNLKITLIGLGLI